MAEDKLIGPNDRRYGSYLPFLEFRQSFNHLEYQDYSRSLDIATAEHRVKYRSNGAHFYFENNEFYAENSMSDEANIFPSKEKEKKIDYRHYDKGIGIDGEIKDNRRQFAAYLKGHELEGETPKLRYSETGIKVSGARKIVFFNAHRNRLFTFFS